MNHSWPLGDQSLCPCTTLDRIRIRQTDLKGRVGYRRPIQKLDTIHVHVCLFNDQVSWPWRHPRKWVQWRSERRRDRGRDGLGHHLRPMLNRTMVLLFLSNKRCALRAVVVITFVLVLLAKLVLRMGGGDQADGVRIHKSRGTEHQQRVCSCRVD